MPTCLGMYIEDNLIKYAKVSKNNDFVKVESFGMKFYENAGETIKQIVEETYSYKTPISVNLSEESYNYFNVFGLLNKKDIDSMIKTNFENHCYDKGINKDSLEPRYIFTNALDSKEKIRVIHISSPKVAIAKRKNQFSEFKLSNMAPTSISVANLINQKENTKQVSLIVNMEETTTVTKISGNTIQDIKTIPYGSKDVLNKINAKENSLAKAYEICKNSTIYTNEAKDLDFEENQHLDDIMPTLYNIVTETRKIMSESLDAIEKVYLTGTLSVVNNIDIYFQEYLHNTKCEILKPYFLNNNSKINIKDYIEVNSAIALGLQMLDMKANNVNFLKDSASHRLATLLKSDINLPRLNEIDFSQAYEKYGNAISVISSTGVFLLACYIAGVVALNGIMNAKYEAAKQAEQDANNKKQVVDEYNTKLNNRLERYKSLISNIEKDNDKESENKRYKNTIPNLMNSLMTIIPKEVQLVSVENPNSTHVVVKAKSAKYEQLAFFKTKIKTDKVLKDVTSDTGIVGDDSSITVTIEGELP